MEIKSEMVNWIIQSEIWWIFFYHFLHSLSGNGNILMCHYTTLLLAVVKVGWINGKPKKKTEIKIAELTKSAEIRNLVGKTKLKVVSFVEDIKREERHVERLTMLSTSFIDAVGSPPSLRRNSKCHTSNDDVDDDLQDCQQTSTLFAKFFFSVREWNFEKLLPILSVKPS